MNKAQLAQELSERVAGVTRSQAEKLLEEFTSLVTQKLLNGEEVVLAGFGAFSARKRKGRIGVNPRNVNEQIEIPSVTVAKFKPGKNLKDTLKKSGTTPVPEVQSETLSKPEIPESTPQPKASTEPQESMEEPKKESQY